MDLLILGASARAAAFSALRAGWKPICGDLFADADLLAACPASAVESGTYPEGLARIAEQVPDVPWLYTGALENHPDLVDRITAGRPLWGNDGASLRAVRDPLEIARVLQRSGLPGPEVRMRFDGLPLDGSWLVKPLASAGGWQIQPLRLRIPLPSQPVYYQHRMEGDPYSAVFLASGGGARLLGATRQLIGLPGQPFVYRGSLGPWPLKVSTAQCLERIGQVLAAWFGLLGLFGVDYVLGREEIPYPIEVNPRYTASVEVLELALNRSLLAEHLEVFAPGRVSRSLLIGKERRLLIYVGKQILYAEQAGQVPLNQDWRPHLKLADCWAEVADCPKPGTRFRAGEPLFSVLTSVRNLDACGVILESKCRTWEARLRNWYEPLQGSQADDMVFKNPQAETS